MTNSNLITVFSGLIANQSIQLANARDLHSFLEIKSAFDNWIKNRITDYGFVQDEDYIIVQERTNGRPRKEYHITLDMGKELAMVERNEKGRQIRKYFIECEREMKRLQKEAENRPLAELPSPYISPAEQQQIQSAVQHTHHRTGLSYQEIYQRIKAKFKVAKYDQLKPEQMRDVLLFIASMQPDFLTQPKQTINVDWFNMMNFALLLKQYHRFTKDLPHIHTYLSAQPEHSAMAGLLKNHLTEMKNNDRLFTDSILSLSEISNHFLPQDQWKSLMRIFSEMIVE